MNPYIEVVYLNLECKMLDNGRELRSGKVGGGAMIHSKVVTADIAVIGLNMECNMLDGKIRMKGSGLQAKQGIKATI